jgi:hypothetical protein
MKNLVVCVWFAVSSLAASAQISNFHTFSGQPLQVKHYDGIDGSPYFNEDWKPGNVLYDNRTIENIQVRYNAFEDIVEMIFENKPFIPDPKYVLGFDLLMKAGESDFRNYRFRKGFEAKGITKSEYLAVIYKGKVSLVEKIKTDQVSVPSPVIGKPDEKKFELTNTILLLKNGEAERFKPSRKAILKAFPKLETKLKEYFDSHTINFKDVDDLANLFAFIDANL